MKLKYLTFILALLFFIGCYKKGGCGDAGMPRVIVNYVDKSGNDLFANGQNGYYIDSTYFKDMNGNFIYSAATYFVASKSSSMEIGPYGNTITQYSTLVVHLKNGVEDTLKRHLTSADACGLLDSVWYNGQLKKAGNQTISGVTNPDTHTIMFSVVH